MKWLTLCATLVGLFLAYRATRLEGPVQSTVFTPAVPEVTVPRNPLWSRPDAAPNGRPWPRGSGYVAGYPRLNAGGYADVIVDNSGGLNDLFVKLVALDGKQPTAVRVAFVRAGDKFPLAQVQLGSYDLRYMNLDTGRIRRTDRFEVTRTRDKEGREQHMGWNVGTFDAIDGNTHHDDITAAEF